MMGDGSCATCFDQVKSVDAKKLLVQYVQQRKKYWYGMHFSVFLLLVVIGQPSVIQFLHTLIK